MYKIIVYSLGFFLITQPAFAHPPSNIQVQYNKSANEIMVTINHRIATGGHEKNRTHFIKEVILQLNGKLADSKTFIYQNHSSLVKTSFLVPKHESDDILSIKAVCSTGSELAKEIPVRDLLQ
ncbi:MAG: hypothetical protein V1747_03125 [Candidatus Omnitrophota bacterium]